MTTERNARKEARNRLMSPGIGLLFMDPLLPLQAADHAWVRTIQEIRALSVSLAPLERARFADAGDGPSAATATQRAESSLAFTA